MAELEQKINIRIQTRTPRIIIIIFISALIYSSFYFVWINIRLIWRLKCFFRVDLNSSTKGWRKRIQSSANRMFTRSRASLLPSIFVFFLESTYLLRLRAMYYNGSKIWINNVIFITHNFIKFIQLSIAIRTNEGVE